MIIGCGMILFQTWIGLTIKLILSNRDHIVGISKGELQRWTLATEFGNPNADAAVLKVCDDKKTEL